MKLGVSYPLNNQAHELMLLMATFAGGHWLRIAYTNGTFSKHYTLLVKIDLVKMQVIVSLWERSGKQSWSVTVIK